MRSSTFLIRIKLMDLCIKATSLICKTSRITQRASPDFVVRKVISMMSMGSSRMFLFPSSRNLNRELRSIGLLGITKGLNKTYTKNIPNLKTSLTIKESLTLLDVDIKSYLLDTHCDLGNLISCMERF